LKAYCYLIQASSRNAYLKYFAECPADIQYAFSYDTIRSEWKKADIYPIDIVQMLSKVPSFAGIIIAEAIASKFTYAKQKLLTS
jgi:hypothetical protein